MPDHPYFNAFNLIPQIGPVKFQKLLNFFPDLATAWQASASDLETAGLEKNVVSQILLARREINPERAFADLERAGVKIVTIRDESYPVLLKEIPHPPALLYIRGELTEKDNTSIAVVGSRKFTSYGKTVAGDLARDLVKAGISVISGLALGLDTIAHRTAVEAEGRTIAVLACGVDSIYPATNRVLADQIIAGKGAVISELPLGTPPLKHHFPNRNRIISGLSLGTVVVEAAADSGALITARHALEQNRQVFAVPGSIYNPMSVGPNNLLKMGARLVTSAADILEELNLASAIQQQLASADIVGDSEEENKILAILTREPLHFDQIAKAVNFPASTVASTLTIMEMKGKVRNLGANQYVKAR